MRILFVDDSGSRGGGKKEAYFCLGGFSIDGHDLPLLATRLKRQRQRWHLAPPPTDEVKMQHVGMQKHTAQRPNPLVREGWDFHARAEYAREALGALASIPSVQVMAVGINRQRLWNGQNPLMWAFRLLLERFEFSLNHEAERVGVIICDNEKSHDALMREAMYSGTVWTKLPSIAETVMFVPSHHSPGVQYADFVVGAASRWWNYRDDRYLRILRPVLRTDPNGKWQGVGLKSFAGADYPQLD